MSRTRVGLIGAGGIARHHLGYLQKMDDVDVVAVTDVDHDRARAMAEEIGAAVYEDHDALLDPANVDAVFICVPPFAHRDQELIAAERGIHFFTEKPHALSMDLARQIEAAVARTGVVTAVGFQDRYQDIMDGMKQYLAQAEAGLFWGSWTGGMPGVPWWRRKAMSGGQHVEQTIHIFDAVRFLLGEVDRVSAVAATTAMMADVEGFDIEEATAVTLHLKNGAVGTIASACFIQAGRAGRSGLEVFCRDARVEYRLRRSVAYYERDQVREAFRMNDQAMACDRTFIEAVQTGDASRIRSPIADANKTLAVVLAAEASLAQGGNVVKVDEI